MIYSINKSITLYSEAADKFLESVGVELYEDHVVIGEDAYLGADGEAILNENGIFLYEDGIVLEGKQAEEYKARKAEDYYTQKHAEIERHMRRYDDDQYPQVGFKDAIHKDGTRIKGTGDCDDYIPSRKSRDGQNRNKAQNMVDKESIRRRDNYTNSERRYDNYKTHSNDELKRLHPGKITLGTVLKPGGSKKYLKNLDTYLQKRDETVQTQKRLYNDKEKDREAYDRLDKNQDVAFDAVHRHIRRHPKQYKEGTIFESVELI